MSMTKSTNIYTSEGTFSDWQRREYHRMANQAREAEAIVKGNDAEKIQLRVENRELQRLLDVERAKVAFYEREIGE